MPLPAPVDDTHAATTNLFKDFVITQAPVIVSDLDCIQRGQKLGTIVDILLVYPGSEHTYQTQTICHGRDAMAARALRSRPSDTRERITEAAKVRRGSEVHYRSVSAARAVQR